MTLRRPDAQRVGPSAVGPVLRISSAVPRAVPYLWSDHEALDTVRFCIKFFPDSRITVVSHYLEGEPLPAETVLVVQFEILDRPPAAMNGGARTRRAAMPCPSWCAATRRESSTASGTTCQLTCRRSRDAKHAVQRLDISTLGVAGVWSPSSAPRHPPTAAAYAAADRPRAPMSALRLARCVLRDGCVRRSGHPDGAQVDAFSAELTELSTLVDDLGLEPPDRGAARSAGCRSMSRSPRADGPGTSQRPTSPAAARGTCGPLAPLDARQGRDRPPPGRSERQPRPTIPWSRGWPCPQDARGPRSSVDRASVS
jgi:hypothetical protein